MIYGAEIASGESDATVIRSAQDEGRLLLTEDKGFGELVFRSKMTVPGVVLLRTNPAEHSLKWHRLKAVIERFGETLLGRYVVVEENRVRSRPLLREI